MNGTLSQKRKVKAAFDNFANEYDSLMHEKMSNYANQFLRGIQISENPTVLDLGCGTGTATFELMKKLHGNGMFHGSDFSQRMIDVAKSRAKRMGLTNVEFRRRDAECLGYPDSSFDLIISSQAFHWIPDKGRALREILRVLKAGGKVGAVFQGGPSFKELLEAYDRIRLRHPEQRLFERPESLSIEQTQDLFIKAGFKKIRISASHEITYINPALFWSNRDLTKIPWKIGLSIKDSREMQKEVKEELLKIKPENPLRSTIYTIFVYCEKNLD